MYTDSDRNTDFHFFIDNYDALYAQYGDCFLAIRDKQVLGHYPSVADAITVLSPTHEFGTYIIQECSASRDSYIVDIPTFIESSDVA